MGPGSGGDDRNAGGGDQRRFFLQREDFEAHETRYASMRA